MISSISSNPTIKRLENERYALFQQIRQYQMLFLGCIGGGAFLIYIYQQGGLSSYPFWVVIFLGGIAIAGVIFCIYNWIMMTQTFIRKIKKQAIKTVFQIEELDWSYEPKNYLEQPYFENSRLFSSKPTNYSGNHLVLGSFDSIPFGMSILDCSRGGGKSQEQIFKGLFIQLNAPNQLKGTTVILPDIAQRILGKSFGKKLQNMNSHRKMKMVYFEEEENFEKKFVVYSSEEASARKILSKEMIQKLLEFNQLYPGKFRVSIQPNAINIAISNMKIFKLSAGQSLTDNNNWKSTRIDLKRLKEILQFFANSFS